MTETKAIPLVELAHPQRVLGSGIGELIDLLKTLNARTRQPSLRLERERRRKTAPLTAAEYWIYLCTVAVLIVATVGGTRPIFNMVQKRAATGAFGTALSSDEPEVVQHARAQEPGRGRHADAPWQIPWRGWKDILWRTCQCDWSQEQK